MTDHAEEQEMEAEALTAIFDTHFAVVDSQADQPEWTIDLYPEQAGDEEELQSLNHVAIQLKIQLPATYPGEEDADLPVLKVSVLKGLAEDPHAIEMQALAEEEADANRGLPSIYAVAEKLREWLVEHNRPGLDDTSAFATMMRKQEKEEKKAAAAAAEFESQTAEEELTAAEKEELAVRKRRAEGTPCTQENFDAWKERFAAEMAAKQEGENQSTGGSDAEIKKSKAVTTSGAAAVTRMTGFEYFSGRSANLEALEAAAEQAETDEIEDEEEEEGENGESGAPNHVNEDLFDDDVDVDDLDFDDEDDDDDEVDI